MNVDRLRYFAAVVESRNLRRAAELVGISPGSMSKAIAVLESELGLKLLRPEGRGIEITSEGLRVYQASAPLLDELRRFKSQVRAPRSGAKEAKLRIGTFEVFSTYFVSALLQSEFCEIDALALELVPRQIESAVVDGLVDIGFTYMPVPHPKLEFIEVGAFSMGIFGLQKWQKLDFLKWPFAVPITPLNLNSSEHASLDLWPQLKPRTVRYEFELLETALQTTRLGLSVLHCPDFVIGLQNQHVVSERRLSELPWPPGMRSPPRIKIYLVIQKENTRKKIIERKTARFLRKIAN